jgi:succinate dehydrogenase hydrophobic anchor subunit
MEGLFLILVVGHSLLGLRSILMDLQPSKSLTSLINWAFLVIGVVAIVYGIWLIGQITQAGVGI